MTAAQAALFDVPEAAPDLAWYDLILVNSSAGKDSQAMLDYVVEEAAAAGVRDRLVVVHCDLGRVEWAGTKALAAEHAAHYGLPFEWVSNRNWPDLLARIEARGMWPDKQNRYCTSEFKTGQVRRLTTALVRLARQFGAVTGRPVRVLNCLGLRAEESRDRAKRPAFLHYPEGKGWSNSLRWVDEWLPIKAWTVDDVWARNAAAGTRHHEAYDQGMPRLSCVFCPLASKSALVRAAQLNRPLADEYVAVELRMGHTFKKNLSMADVVAAADRATDLVEAATWEA